MSAAEIRKLILTRLGVRIEPEMSAYLLDGIAGGLEEIAVMGGDARTGEPVRRIIPEELLQQGRT